MSTTEEVTKQYAVSLQQFYIVNFVGIAAVTPYEVAAILQKEAGIQQAKSGGSSDEAQAFRTARQVEAEEEEIAVPLKVETEEQLDALLPFINGLVNRSYSDGIVKQGDQYVLGWDNDFVIQLPLFAILVQERA